MKKLRKYITAAFCLCIASYAVPSFAEGNEFLDVDVSDYKQVDGTAQAVFANRSGMDCQYTLTGISIAGAEEILDSGTLAPGQAVVSVGTPVTTQTIGVSARMWQPGKNQGFEAIDASFAVKY